MKKNNLARPLQNFRDLFLLLGKGSVLTLLFFFVSGLVEAIFPLLTAYLGKQLIGELEVRNTEWTVLAILVGMVFAVNLVGDICKMMFSYIRRYLASSVNFSLKTKLYEKCDRLTLRAFDHPDIYDKLTVAERLSSVAVTDLASGLFACLSGVFQLISGGIILSALSPWLLLAVIGASLTGLAYGSRDFSYEEFDKRRTKLVRRMNYFKKVATQGAYTKEIKVNGMWDYILERYNRYNEEWNETEMKYAIDTDKMGLVLDPMRELVIFVIPAGFFVFAVSHGNMTVADFSYYISMLTICLGALNGLINRHFSRMISGVRIRDYMDFLSLDEDERTGLDIPKEWHHIPPEIEFRNVSFRYCGADRNAIDHINITLKPGERIVIIGENGAGKTTLIKLLTGLYEPTEGDILLDGISVRVFSQRALYQLYSVVFQDYATYEMSLRDTLSMGSHVSDEQIKAAFGQLDDDGAFVRVFHSDLTTRLGKTLFEDGISLSGGENQKIALARAQLQSRAVVILDEATASLDAYAEQRVLGCFLRERKEKTTVMISHRIGCAAMCDRVIVLADGHIVEDGTHDRLAAAGGEYARLYAAQAGAYRGDGESIRY